MKALGLIETYGMVAAIEALDTAVKAANVEAKYIEKVKGGLITVSVYGDVGAVKAAIDSGSIAAAKVGKVLSTLVIPRPDSEVAKMIDNKKTNSNNLVSNKPAQVEKVNSEKLSTESKIETNSSKKSSNVKK